MGNRNLKIGLDSTVFKNRKFIDWLIYNKGLFETHISEVAYMETLLWYKRLDIGKEGFDDDLNELQAKIIFVDMKLSDLITENAVKFGKAFPFRDHARDYVIGSIAESEGSYLITDNVKHFRWLSGMVQVMTPEEFVYMYVKKEYI
jgi:predicted nucleic acid-binding protein